MAGPPLFSASDKRAELAGDMVGIDRLPVSRALSPAK